MHAALHVPEILKMIFDICSEPPPKARGYLNYIERDTFCTLAICCMAWRELALDRIWQSLPSLEPLLPLIPGMEKKLKGGSPYVDFSDLSPDLTRFLFYARRVKHVSNHSAIRIDPSIFTILIYNSTGTVFPNLVTAQFSLGVCGDTQIALCFSPRLRSLDLHYGGIFQRDDPSNAHPKERKADLTSKFLRQVAAHGVLEELDIRGDGHLSFSDQKLIVSLSSLRVLAIHTSSHGLSGSTVAALSSLPHLRELDIDLDSVSADGLEDCFSAIAVHTLFPSLTRLKTSVVDVAITNVILRKLPPNTLRILHVDAGRGAAPLSFWCPLLKIIPKSVEELLLNYEMDIPMHMEGRNLHIAPELIISRQFSMDHLKALSHLPLRTLELSVSLPPDLSDEDVKQMVGWWPEMEILRLGNIFWIRDYIDQLKPRATLDSLTSLTLLPKLDHLVLVFEARGPTTVGTGRWQEIVSQEVCVVEWESSPWFPDIASVNEEISCLAEEGAMQQCFDFRRDTLEEEADSELEHERSIQSSRAIQSLLSSF